MPELSIIRLNLHSSLVTISALICSDNNWQSVVTISTLNSKLLSLKSQLYDIIKPKNDRHPTKNNTKRRNNNYEVGTQST